MLNIVFIQQFFQQYQFNYDFCINNFHTFEKASDVGCALGSFYVR